MTSAELEQVSAELAAIEAEQKELLACFVVRDFPEDVADQWCSIEGWRLLRAERPDSPIGPRELWIQLLAWAMCLVCVAVAFTWRGHTPTANPDPAPAPAPQAGNIP
jgi:hypothetical protein